MNAKRSSNDRLLMKTLAAYNAQRNAAARELNAAKGSHMRLCEGRATIKDRLRLMSYTGWDFNHLSRMNRRNKFARMYGAGIAKLTAMT